VNSSESLKRLLAIDQNPNNTIAGGISIRATYVGLLRLQISDCLCRVVLDILSGLSNCRCGTSSSFDNVHKSF